MFGGFLKLCVSHLRHSRGSISHVWMSKKPKKNNIVSRFHQITPQKTSTKLRKIGFGAFKHVQVPMFGGFLKLSASRLRHSTGAISHVWMSKKPKK